MNVHSLLNLLTSYEKSKKCEACRAFYCFFAACIINSAAIQEHKCKIYTTFNQNYFETLFWHETLRKC